MSEEKNTIILKQRARQEGREASEKGKRINANPYAEDDDLHWQWLDAWCVAEQGKTLTRYADKAGIANLKIYTV